MPLVTLPLVSPNRGCYNFRARLRAAFCQMCVPFRKSSEMQMAGAAVQTHFRQAIRKKAVKDMSNYDTLNPMQKEAVLCTEGPLLILAGAGSGKTRVLTHRVAYLIEEKGVNPWNILAITFTNKAAGEMRERVDNLVGFGAESIWVSTFHSSCVRILRRHIEYLGYSTNFSIYDTDDQRTLMKQVFKTLDVDTKQFKERGVLGVISSAKDKLISPEAFLLNAGDDFREKKIGEIYKEYQKQLKKNNALDFDDLIVKTVELFQIIPRCWIITRSGSAISWWTSIRIRIMPSLSW